jgi:hypothetical protein
MQAHGVYREPDAKRRREVGSTIKKEVMKMYSPKIREDLIPEIYRAAKVLGLRMTVFVNQILERVLNEVGWFEEEETESNENALAIQTGLEKAMNDLRGQINSFLVGAKKETSIFGEFKISLNKKTKPGCRIITTDPKRGGSIVYPRMAKRTKALNGGDELGAKEIISSGQESNFPKENGREHGYS